MRQSGGNFTGWLKCILMIFARNDSLVFSFRWGVKNGFQVEIRLTTVAILRLNT